MRLDWELARRGYRRYAAYPAATCAGIFTNVFFGFLIAYVLLAVFETRRRHRRLRRGDALAYVWLAQAMLARRRHLRAELVRARAAGRSGDVATDLTGPCDLQRRALRAGRRARGVSARLARPCRSSCVGAILFEIRRPPKRSTGSLFVVSVALAIVVSFAIRFLVNLVARSGCSTTAARCCIALAVNRVLLRA